MNRNPRVPARSSSVSSMRPSSGGQNPRISTNRARSSSASRGPSLGARPQALPVGGARPRSSGVRNPTQALTPRSSHIASRLSETDRRTTMSRIKDTRPLSDKSYQKKCIRKLSEFLISTNCPLQITPAALTSPSLKDFLRIFEYLYGFLNTRFQLHQTNPSDQIVLTIKALQYPFAISKSHLLNPGSRQSWGHLLGFLTWLIDNLKYASHYEVMGPGGIGLDLRNNAYTPDSEFDSQLPDALLKLSCNMFLERHDPSYCEDNKKMAIKQLVNNHFMHEDQMDEAEAKREKVEQDLRKVQDELEAIHQREKEGEALLVDIGSMEKYLKEAAEYCETKSKENENLQEKLQALEIRSEILESTLLEKNKILTQQNSKGLNVKLLKKQRELILTETEELVVKIDRLQNEKYDMEMNQLNHYSQFAAVCQKFDEWRKTTYQNCNGQATQDQFPDDAAMSRLKNLDFCALRSSPQELYKAVDQLVADVTAWKRFRISRSQTYNATMLKDEQMLIQLEFQSSMLTDELDAALALLKVEKDQRKSHIKDFEQERQNLREQNLQLVCAINQKKEKIAKPANTERLEKELQTLNSELSEIKQVFEAEKEKLEEEVMKEVKVCEDNKRAKEAVLEEAVNVYKRICDVVCSIPT